MGNKGYKKKTRVYRKVPQKHKFERQAAQLSLLDVYRVKEYAPDPNRKQPYFPLWAVAWGWNSGGRAGNTTAVELRAPGHVQKSVKQRYIACATGKHHSLLVTDDGHVYSFGEGKRQQLGLGNVVTSMPVKGGFTQAFPKRVNPSGELRYGHDIKVIEVAAGDAFSVAREADVEEGMALSNGLHHLIARLKELRRQYPDSSTLQKAWAAATNERSMIARVCRGTVTMWGQGKRGQLGMGRHVTQLAYPRPIPRLNRTRIVKLSAGENHVLAIDSGSELYSWGVGSGGRLGHMDYDDRHYPTKVEFFETYYVEDASAGDRHSAVLTTSRKGSREIQEKRVACFGRGAHGRLGNGNNRNQHTPVPVLEWPASVLGMHVKQIACGGAHTLCLMWKRIPRTLANPWAIETAVVGWGYGMNGQLGTGYRLDTFVPVRAKIAKWEFISDICAGRSWSMARTIGGELFTFGKGLRGQTGQGPLKFSLAPRKLDTFGAFVKLSAGFGHSVCVVCPKKYFNPSMTKTEACYKDPLKPIVDIAPDHYDGSAKFAFDCCRRTLAPHKRHIRVRCVTCNMPNICHLCGEICHRGHELVSANVPEGQEEEDNPNQKIGTGFSRKREMGDGEEDLDIKETYCICGIEDTCKILPVMDENDAEIHGDDYEMPHLREERLAAECMQRLARKFLGRRAVQRMMRYVSQLRFDACERYFEKEVLQPIFDKVEQVFASFWEERGKVEMAIEETLRKKYDYMLNMQHAIQGCEAMMFGVRNLVKQMCPSMPAQSNGVNQPSYGFSWASVRAEQLKLHPHSRCSREELTEATSYLPRYDKYEGHCSDKDLVPYVERFLKSLPLEEEREKARAVKKWMDENAEKIKQQKALDRLAKLGRKKPPPPPPMSPVDLRRYQRMQAFKKEVQERERIEREREDGDEFSSTKLRDPLIVKRRHSLSDPWGMYSRLQHMRNKVTLRGFAHRRDSLPMHVDLMHPATTKVAGLHREEVRMSLAFFKERNEEIRECVHESFYDKWHATGPVVKRRHEKALMQKALMNPRGPLEMILMITDPGRRRTVAEPERLELQMYYAFEVRNNLAELRAVARRADKLPVRRRSFDHAETREYETGMSEILGYDYDPPYEALQKSDFTQFSSNVSKTMAIKGLVMTDDMVWAKNNSLMTEFYAKREELERVEEQRRLLREGKPSTKKWGKPAATKPEIWQEHYSDEGYTYYFKVDNGESSWELPTGDNVQICNQHQDDDGNWYWYNNVTGEATWVE